jgi:hypothetical protein
MPRVHLRRYELLINGRAQIAPKKREGTYRRNRSNRSWAARKGGATGNVSPENSRQVRAGANPEYDPALPRGDNGAGGEYCGAAADGGDWGGGVALGHQRG